MRLPYAWLGKAIQCAVLIVIWHAGDAAWARSPSSIEMKTIEPGRAAPVERDQNQQTTHAPAAGASQGDAETHESAAGSPAEADTKPRPFDLRTTDRVTADWGGVRTKLEEIGIKFRIDVMNQFMVNMHGGLETKNGNDFAGSYEFNVYLDLEKMKLIDGAEFWMRAKGTWGGDNSDFDKEKIGGLFKTNQDASSEEPIFVDKWHYKQMLAKDRVELRIGRMEPVKDLFDTSKIIGHEDKYFMNQALVRNATIPADKGLAAYLNVKLGETFYVRGAVFDAQAEDRQTNFNTAFHDEDLFRVYMELGATPKFKTEKGKLWGHYRAGTWFDPSTKERFFDTLGGALADRFDSNDWGFYVGADQMVWKENDEPKDGQGLAIAGRYGYAPGEVNRIEHFWAAAAAYTGPIPQRDKDVLAFGIGQGILSDEYRRVHPRADRETVYELYYAIYVTPWLTITPDVQFIANAGGDKDDDNAFVAGLRVRTIF